MITFIEGVLEEKQPTRAILNVGGVGYEVFIPLSSYDQLPPRGNTTRLLVHDHVREDAHLLFGFATEKERRMFRLVTGISGVGPKLALSALSGLTVRELTAAVIEGDVPRLNAISGVGKKTAERLVVELRDKIDEADALDAVAGPEGDGAPGSPVLRDAMSALVALGYKQDAARKMVQRVMKAGADDRTVEDVIRESLSR